MMSERPTDTWLVAWRRTMLDRLPRRREDTPWLWILAAQAESDLSLARRMAIVEVLMDGRPHPALDLRAAVEKRLGEGCFGAQAEQTLEADLAALCSWGVRIDTSDTPGVEGYYLLDPPVVRPCQPLYQEEPSPLQAEIYRTWDGVRKMRRMFEMFEFALRQVRTGTRLRHPDWSDEQVEAEARRLVTGVEPATGWRR